MNNFFQFSRWASVTDGTNPLAILAFLYHLPNFIRLSIRLLKDPRVPFFLKFLCYAAIVYFFFPFDLIRDIPYLLIGRVDDLLFLFLAFRKLLRDSPPEVVQEHVLALSNKSGNN